MNITVRENAKHFIRQKGGAVYIDAEQTSVSCCLHVNLGPSVRLGIPDNNQQFGVEEFDGITLYIPKEFASPFPFTIVVSQLFWYEHLAIEGWKLI